jgi:hypothetical protein
MTRPEYEVIPLSGERGRIVHNIDENSYDWFW